MSSLSGSSSPAPAAILAARKITKKFTGTLALDGVDFTLRPGEIHALMGENGAGKSTLIKVLTGVNTPDGGEILLGGKVIHPRSPQHAQEMGISTVYQEVNLIPGLSVAENLFIGRQPRRWGRIAWKQMNGRARELMRGLDLDIDVTRPVGEYSIALQQMTAIARALDVKASVLILDEPTSSLDRHEVANLFGVMRKLRDQGLGIVFVTHFMDQVYSVSDRITVLRNGRLVGEYEAKTLPRLELVARMMGRAVEQVQAMEHAHAGAAKVDASSGQVAGATAGQTMAEPWLRLRGVGRRGAIEPMDLDIARGEVVGLAGLLGAGRTETARLIFGVDRADSGEIRVESRARRLRNPRQAIALGMGFCPEDRKSSGILPDLSVRENIVLVLQGQRGIWRPISRRKQQALAQKYIDALRIKTSDADKAIKLLSGGNQQKAILARWLASEPALLILDEPTRGIDVGAKFEIARLIESVRQEGMAVLFISSELEEVIRSSSRVVVLRDRHKVAELEGARISEAAVMAAIAAN